MDDSSSLAKWSSMDLLPLDSSGEAERSGEENSRQRSSLQQTTNLKSSEPAVSVRRVHSLHMSSNTSPIPPHDKLPHSAAPHLMFSRPSQDLPDVDEGGRLAIVSAVLQVLRTPLYRWGESPVSTRPSH